jgi:hypothetical protein
MFSQSPPHLQRAEQHTKTTTNVPDLMKGKCPGANHGDAPLQTELRPDFFGIALVEPVQWRAREYRNLVATCGQFFR